MQIRTLFIRSIVVLVALAVGIAIAQNDWPAYGRDPGAQRYSPLTQINASNVSQLIQVWKYETRPASETNAKAKRLPKYMRLRAGRTWHEDAKPQAKCSCAECRQKRVP